MTTRSALGERLFTFAVIADSHLNPEEDRSSSPYDCNRLANARARAVIQELNREAPAFVLHLGDIVHPVPKLESYAEAAARFHELFADLEPRLVLCPGNHDVGDKPVGWAPAGAVREAWLSLYRSHFGPDFQSFEHGGVRFVVVNAQVMNSGLPSEDSQREFLERELAPGGSGRIIVAIHYPPYVTHPEEPSSYDNIDEPARSWFLSLCEKRGVEAMYCGHVHNYFWDEHRGTDISILPSIAFVRHDYAELFRVAPDEDSEHGRDDRNKLGYLLVDVHEHGRVDRVVRTSGRTAAKGDDATVAIRGRKPFDREAAPSPLGLDLSAPWAEIVDVPPSGALEAFGRKRARNDYALLAIRELGARDLRVPIEDLCDAEVRARMQKLAARGHAFTVVSYGVPSEARADLLVREASTVAALEVILGRDDAFAKDHLMAFSARTTIAIDLAEIRGHGARDASGRYHHLVDYGLQPAEEREAESLSARFSGVARGLAFVIHGDAPAFEGILAATKTAARLGVAANVRVRLSGKNIAAVLDDDTTIAARALESFAAAEVAARDASQKAPPRVFFDGFVDRDRGYFVRHGLYDRRYDPRLAARCLAHLRGALASLGEGPLEGEAHEVAGARAIALRSARGGMVILPSGLKHRIDELPFTIEHPIAHTLDLESGQQREVSPASGGLDVAGPTAILFGAAR